VLEVGCGRGIALAALDRHCAPSRLVGLDIDRALLTEARESLEADCVSAELIASDLRCMPFPDAAFDLVIDFGTCYHVSRREEALREIHRVLAPGGIFATETPLAQALAHPIRTQGKALPWHAVPDMTLRHDAVLWASWKKG
ncbi:MAG: class I SAM-dependent methyltransferase, partial [Dehalococcoidia bacterium]